MKDINLNSRGEVLPATSGKIALIDADTIIFAAATVVETIDILLPKDMYSDNEWDILIHTPGYRADEGAIYATNIEDAVEHSMSKINRLLELSGCTEFELHFTAGRESFRYTKVDKEYKQNRTIDSQGKKTHAPYGLHQIKQEMCRLFPLKATMWYECEADDAVWWLGNKYPDKYLVCAVDKDVLGATKAQGFNYFERRAYTHPKSGKAIPEITMRFVQAEFPDTFWYHQCLTGDSGDGIIGVKGIGPAKAKKLLSPCTTNKERWDTIVHTYELHNRGMIDALLNMRMVRLDQYNPETNELTLFDPRNLK